MKSFPSTPRHFHGIAQLSGWTVSPTSDGYQALAGRNVVARYHTATNTMECWWDFGPPSTLAANEYRLLVHSGPDRFNRHSMTLEWACECSTRRRAQVFHANKEQLIADLKQRSPSAIIVEIAA